MADRNPSDWTRWNDEQALRRGKNVVLTVPDLTFDDLQYMRDAPMLLISDCFPTRTTASGTPVEKYRVRFHNKDIATSASTTTPVTWSARVRVSGGATLTVTLDDGTTTDTATSTSATDVWLPLQTGYTLKTNAVDVDLIVSIHISSGAGTVRLDGLMLYAEAT